MSKLDWSKVISYSNNGSPAPTSRVEKSEQEWQEVLTNEQFLITRKRGTEAPHSNDLCSSYEEGVYSCVCCSTILFDSSIKFNSGSGWPSFTEPFANNVIRYIRDTDHGMTRVEVVCSVCDAHLGHVFPDGPEPSGLRYCINAASLKMT